MNDIDGSSVHREVQTASSTRNRNTTHEDHDGRDRSTKYPASRPSFASPSFFPPSGSSGFSPLASKAATQNGAAPAPDWPLPVDGPEQENTCGPCAAATGAIPGLCNWLKPLLSGRMWILFEAPLAGRFATDRRLIPPPLPTLWIAEDWLGAFPIPRG